MLRSEERLGDQIGLRIKLFDNCPGLASADELKPEDGNMFADSST